MDQAHFIVREPLLDPKGRLLGYELTWHRKDDSAAQADGDANALAALLAAQLNNAESGWQLGDSILFLKATPHSLAAQVADSLPTSTTVFFLVVDELDDAAKVTAV